MWGAEENKHDLVPGRFQLWGWANRVSVGLNIRNWRPPETLLMKQSFYVVLLKNSKHKEFTTTCTDVLLC